MIDLTRLNGHRLVVNCDLFKFAEASPDTTITLITGEKLVVLESLDQLVELIGRWRAHVLHLAWPDASHALCARFAIDQSNKQQTTENE